MNTLEQTTKTDIKALLSTLWIFFLLNILFRDIHEFVAPGFLQEALNGTVNGVRITDELMMLGWILAEIPIAMVLLSRILPYGVNRWPNIIVGILMIAFVISNGAGDPDDLLFAISEIVALVAILWSAWRWPNPARRLTQTNQPNPIH
ncbi:MAG: DUF6326 family protein [Chloroflexota bacterium]